AKPDRPLPPPPKPGMFGGKIRIVTAAEDPDILLASKKPEEATAPEQETPKAPPAEPPKPAPPSPPEAPKPAPEPPTPPPPPSRPTTLGPGQSVRFDDDQAP
ncbi:MAG TPA: hypothetical protein VJ694_03565, partial [Patescibacteria group bacterium]|nr:hypothetical protein [Patescibacteria group bacterium]